MATEHSDETRQTGCAKQVMCGQFETAYMKSDWSQDKSGA